MTAGEKVLLRMQELKKSRRQVAAEAGLSPTFVAAVCRNEKGLGIESARKLARALEWPDSELLGEVGSQQGIEPWFWSTRLATLSEEDLDRLRRASPAVRAAWSLREAASHFPDFNMAAAIGTSADHIQRIMQGRIEVTGPLLDAMASGLLLPPHWITLGGVPPSDLLLQKVLQHRYAKEWIELVAEAIDKDVPPYKLRSLMNAFIDLADAK